MDSDLKIVDRSLTDRGIVPFHAVDQNLVTNMCNTIRVLYRLLQEKYTDEELRAKIKDSE